MARSAPRGRRFGEVSDATTSSSPWITSTSAPSQVPQAMRNRSANTVVAPQDRQLSSAATGSMSSIDPASGVVSVTTPQQ